MFGKLFILFAVLPIIEIMVLVNVTQEIGGWNTFFLVVATAFIGAYLVRQQGLATLTQAQRKMQAGGLPETEMAEGLLLVIAGVLLVTPGFITDGLGFLLSLPMTRPLIAKALLKKMTVKMASSQGAGFHSYQQWQQPNRRTDGDSDIIEGEYENKDDPNERIDGPKNQ